MILPIVQLALCLLSPQQTTQAQATAAVVRENFEVLKTLEFHHAPNDFSYVDDALDLTPDGKSLIYLAGGSIYRIDLESGKTEEVVAGEELQEEEENIDLSPNLLLITEDPNRLVFANRGSFNCPWNVRLITLRPLGIKKLTDEGCGRILLLPGALNS